MTSTIVKSASAIPNLLFRAPAAKVFTWRFLSGVVGVQTALCSVVGPGLVIINHASVSAPVAVLSAAAAVYSGLFAVGLRFYTKRYVVAMHQPAPETVSISTLSLLGNACEQITIPLSSLQYPSKRSLRRPSWFGLRVSSDALRSANVLSSRKTLPVGVVRALSPLQIASEEERQYRELRDTPLANPVTNEMVVRETGEQKKQRRVFIVDVEGEVFDRSIMRRILFGSGAPTE